MIVDEKADLSRDQISFEQRARQLEAERLKEEQERENQRKGPFSHFYQINKSNSRYLRSCADENPQALKILLFLFEHMDHYNAVICSYAVFADVLNMSERTISRSIKYLKEHRFIYVYKSGSSNVYVANDALAWNSWGTNVKYCKFPANIVLSSSEQENMDVEIKSIKQRIIKTEAKGVKKNGNKNTKPAN